MRTVTATNLPRFMICNGSRLMEVAEATPVTTDNTLAKEGDAADWLCVIVHQQNIPAQSLLGQQAPNGVYITQDIINHTEEYLIGIGRNGQVQHELSFGTDKWKVNCRLDHCRYHQPTDTLFIDDLKMGWGIIEPYDNWTMLAYAIAFCITYQIAPRLICLTIYQPRPYHSEGTVRTWEISYERLMKFYEQIDQTLSNPSDMLITSKECYKCPAMAHCPAARAASFNALEAAEMAFNSHIDNVNLAVILDAYKRAAKIIEQNIEAYEELAAHRIKLGELVKNYGLETSFTNRVFKDGVTLELMNTMTGKDCSKPAELATPNQLENRGVDKTIISAFTTRHSKGAKLVRVDENRKAEKLFKPKTKGN